MLKIKFIEVSGLFGKVNYSIPFNNENILLLTAPNGFGKTITLKIIDSIFNDNLEFLIKLNFERITIHLHNSIITVKKVNSEKDPSLNIAYYDDYGVQENYNYSIIMQGKQSQNKVRFISRNLPFLTRVSPRTWLDSFDDTELTLNDILEKYGEVYPELTEKGIPKWLQDLREKNEVYFIKDQRLIDRDSILELSKRNRRTPVEMILKYSSELLAIIQKTSSESAIITQELDSSFPFRLLSPYEMTNIIDIDYIKLELDDIKARRSILSGFGLISTDDHVPDLFIKRADRSDAKALSLYIEDTKIKIKPYEILAEKIHLFISILNNKGLVNKRVLVNSKKGFFVMDGDGRELELTDLSSGEQHQIVLLYELIFKLKDDTMVLIDEPEISLHVAWQKEFLNDLKQIIGLKNIDVIIATHSPQIVNGNWELVVDLSYGGN